MYFLGKINCLYFVLQPIYSNFAEINNDIYGRIYSFGTKVQTHVV